MEFRDNPLHKSVESFETSRFEVLSESCRLASSVSANELFDRVGNRVVGEVENTIVFPVVAIYTEG